MEIAVSLLYRLILVLFGLQPILGLTIKELIEQRPELSMFKDFTKLLPFLADLGANGEITYTLFAPNDDAFRKLAPRKLLDYQRPSLSLKLVMENILKFHTVDNVDGGKVKTADFNGQVLSSTAKGLPKLFLRTVGGAFYINGAKIVMPDIEASNGVIHVIDTLLENVGLTMNALEFIESTRQDMRMHTKKFSRMLSEYEEQKGAGSITATWHLNRATKLTLFAPSDAAFSHIPTQQYNNLLKDVTFLKKVVEGHLITDEAYHLNLLTRPEYITNGITAMDGRVMPKLLSGDVYVSNKCAQGKVIFANITVSNGVIHIVDGLLGFVYNDAFSYFKYDPQLSKMYGHIMGSDSIREMLKVESGDPVPENRRLTIFGATDDNMKGVDFTQDSRYLERVLRMHILRGMLELSSMKNGTKKATLNDGSTAIFFRYGNDQYVEVDYVRAKITQGDICVKNGIVHKIDHVLGVPRYTVEQELETNDHFREMYRVSRDSGLSQYLRDTTKKITVFAPVDSAFEMMQDTEIGRRLLDHKNARHMKNVLDRHILYGELFLDQLPDGVSKRETVFHDTMTIEKNSNGYRLLFDGQSIAVIRANMRMKNGVLHVIDRVMYSSNARSAEWTSRAHSAATPVATLLLVAAVVGRIVL